MCWHAKGRHLDRRYLGREHVRELETLDVSEIHARRLNAEEVLMPKNGEEFIFSVADGSFKLAGWDQVFRKSASRQEHPARGEEHNDVPQGESDGSQLSDHQTDYIEARNDFWSISGHHIYRHHVQPRVKLYVPKEGSFPTPLKHIDVSGGRIRRWMCCWKVASAIGMLTVTVHYQGHWTGFTQFTILSEKPPNGYTWSGGTTYESSSHIHAR